MADVADISEGPDPEPVPRPQPQYDTLVLSGGGVLATAFTGCLRYLEHAGISAGFRTLIGTSAGSIVAFLTSLGLTADEVLEWCTINAASGNLTQLDLSGLLSLPDRLGLDDGARLTGCLSCTLRARLPGWADLEEGDDISFRQFTKATGRNLVVVASDLVSAQPWMLNVDRDPDLGVVRAVRMSCSIPLLFTPVPYRNSLLVDGCMFANCPVPSERQLAGVSRARVLALSLAGEPRWHRAPRKTESSDAGEMPGLLTYLHMLGSAVISRAQVSGSELWGHSVHSDNSENSEGGARVVVLPFPENPPTTLFKLADMAFDLTPEAITALDQHGYDTLRSALDIELCPRRASKRCPLHPFPEGAAKIPIS